MKILLFGKNGQVGWELQRSLAPLGDIVALDHDGAPGLSGNSADPESLAATVRARSTLPSAPRPHWMFHVSMFM